MMDIKLLIPWGGFTLFIIILLALDVGLFQRRAHVIKTKEALLWFGIWSGLALLFNLGIVIFHERGLQAGLEFFTGYLVEKSLSIDNIFVFLLIFNYFRVPSAYQHKVLFLGILGALVLRLAFIILGLALIEQFHWMIYVFGTLLLLTGISMIRKKETAIDIEKNWVVSLIRRLFPITDRYNGNRFFIRISGKLLATPLLIVLVAIESSDIIFAVDSIPAIFAITSDPFIVFASNIFAMLGLRALYFGVHRFMGMFHFLRYGFACIVLILGTKMLLSDVYELPLTISLGLIIVTLLICIIASLLRPRPDDLKIVFERPEQLGLIPFRRLLLIENIVDLGDLSVQSAMRHRSGIHSIRLDLPWEENYAMIRETRFSRYPLIESPNTSPIGIIHIKDLFLLGLKKSIEVTTLRQLARPSLQLYENSPLEDALAKFQNGFHQFATVFNSNGEWIGIITFEDLLEEIVGNIHDEFDISRLGKMISLADALSKERVLLNIQASSVKEAIYQIITQVPSSDLPANRQQIIAAILERESAMATYLGRGLALPHCRQENIDKPILIFARSQEGVPIENTNERIELFFLLITPSSMARLQPRLLADIVGIIDSDYVTERLKTAIQPEEIIQAIRDGQQVVLD